MYFRYWPTLEEAQRWAVRMNLRRVQTRNPAVGDTEGFITATEYQARIEDFKGRHDPE